MQYRSYVIIFVIRPCGKKEVGHRPRDVNSDVQRVYNIDDAMLVEKIVVRWNHESILNTFRIRGKWKTAKVLLFEFIGRRWRRNIRFIRLNELQNNVRDAVDDVHGGAVDTDSA